MWGCVTHSAANQLRNFAQGVALGSSCIIFSEAQLSRALLLAWYWLLLLSAVPGISVDWKPQILASDFFWYRSSCAAAGCSAGALDSLSKERRLSGPAGMHVGALRGAEYFPGHTSPHVHISTHTEFCPRTRVLCSSTVTLHPAPFPIPTEEPGAGGAPVQPACCMEQTTSLGALRKRLQKPNPLPNK